MSYYSRKKKIESRVIMDHWNSHARQWSHVGPPLRPSRYDTDYITKHITANAGAHSPNALLLGVTSELAQIDWPVGTTLFAIDRNREMISCVWPWPQKKLRIDACVIQGEWVSLPVHNTSVDIVVGDGCFTLLAGTKEYHAVTAEINRVLKPEGLCIMRFFTRPKKAETPEAVIDDLRHARIANFHIFKWRLAMAMHDSFAKGVSVADVWEMWRSTGIDATRLAYERGWPVAEVNTIDVYKNSSARYFFPTMDELHSLLGEYFNTISVHFPDYEMGDRCPIIGFVPKH